MGLILVFDLDETITYTDSENNVHFNDNVIDLFAYIKQKFLRGVVIDAIFLLTNNSDKKYIKNINDFIVYHLRNTNNNTLNNIGNIGNIGIFTGGEEGYPEGVYFFDYIMDYVHSHRNPRKTKSLADIKYMADKIGLTYNNDLDLLNRTFFFDDRDHVIKTEMEEHGIPHHYIKITPPYEPDLNDYFKDDTNYKSVYDAIKEGIYKSLHNISNDNLSGGNIKKKSSRYKKRRTLKRLRYKKRKTFKRK